jgi:hypothetical protein
VVGYCELLILFIFLRWHYSPTRTFASLMDFSQLDLIFDLLFQFLILHLHTVLSSVFFFWLSSQSTFLRIIVKYLICFSFTIYAINMNNPVELTDS